MVYASKYLFYGLLFFWLLSMYVAMDFLVFIVFHLMDTVVLIVIYRDFLCYLSIDHEVAINLS